MQIVVAREDVPLPSVRVMVGLGLQYWFLRNVLRINIIV